MTPDRGVILKLFSSRCLSYHMP